VDIEFDKASQRTAFRQRRDEFVGALSPADKSLAFSRLPSPLKAMLVPGLKLAGYVAKSCEADPAKLLSEAREMGCEILLPHVTSKSAPMRFLRWDEQDSLVEGPFGLMQPIADAEPCCPDIALVPLIAFDARLMRLGQGAGHYDRALSILDNITAVGLAWSVQYAPALNTDPWDVPLDAVLTEKSWITL
jgi:5-formyltetrahydrofolate cyclo-ligase